MTNEIETLIKFYQQELDSAESNYDTYDRKSWVKIQYLNKIVNKLHDVRMYCGWMEEE